MAARPNMASSLRTSGKHLWQRLRSQSLQNLINSRYIGSVGAQALVSGFHFSLNLALLPLLSKYDYGLFAYAFVLGMFAQAINNALISTPLTVYTPVIEDATERRKQEQMLSTANLLFLFGLLVTGLLASFYSSLPFETALGITVYVAVYSARHFSRSFGYARLRPLVTALGDLCYVICGSLILLALLWGSEDPSILKILGSLALANLFAIGVERSLLHGKSMLKFALRSLLNYRVIWEQSRWALLGALTTLFMSQAHSLIVTGMQGPSAFAPLAAGFVLFGPVRVALMTWQNMVKPEFALHIAEKKSHLVNQRVIRTSWLMCCAVLAMAAFLYFCWPLIHQFLYAKKYAQEPMALIVGVWAIITFFAALYNAPSAALQAMRDFRVLAFASFYGAIISLLTVTTAVLLYKPETTLYGILLAEMFTAFFLIRVMLQKLKENR